MRLGKRANLQKNARPKGTQIWLGGAVVEDRPEIFWFKVLKHPTDAQENKPRGKAELLECFRSMGMKKCDIFVSEGWKGTKAAIHQMRVDMNWSEDDLLYELCNHSAGESKRVLNESDRRQMVCV